MATTTLEKFTPETAIAFPVDTAEIAEAVAPCLAMKIAGVNDTIGFKAVHEARMKLKDMRVRIEKKRKELKEGALEYGRLVDSEAKRLTAPLLPAEEHLEAEEKRINAEKDRIKAEAEAARQRKIQVRVDALAECRAAVDLSRISAMTDEEFDAHLQVAVEANQRRLEAEAEAEAERKREQARLDAEAAERRRVEEARLAELREQQRIENERLAAVRAELDRQRREQQERQAALEAEQRRLAEEAAAVERRAQAERDRLEAEQRREAEAKDRADREAAEKARLESLRPDREKLLAVVESIRAIKVPEVSNDPTAQRAAQLVRQTIASAAEVAAGIITRNLGGADQ
ncbi:MAG: hypothetical protein IT428_06170 [Planctomycetaceae bacterium]|nr:hypothetical protein [Planctomycetaceae bacterium]